MRERPQNVRFRELIAVLERVGYELDRQRGSHLIFHRSGYPTANIQSGKGGKAKPYQVRQVLTNFDEYGIKVE